MSAEHPVPVGERSSLPGLMTQALRLVERAIAPLERPAQEAEGEMLPLRQGGMAEAELRVAPRSPACGRARRYRGLHRADREAEIGGVRHDEAVAAEGGIDRERPMPSTSRSAPSLSAKEGTLRIVMRSALPLRHSRLDFDQPGRRFEHEAGDRLFHRRRCRYRAGPSPRRWRSSPTSAGCPPAP